LNVLVLLALLAPAFPVFGQRQVRGSVVDAASQAPLAYVNIAIKQKNQGTTSLPDGTFALSVDGEALGDTLLCSLVGYHPAQIPLGQLLAAEPLTIHLHQKTVPLSEVKVTAEKLVEKKFGIKRRNALLHFTDGMFLNAGQNSFEIGQVIELGDQPARITSVYLHINAPRADSASFRINFYRHNEEGPAGRLVEKSIVQRHPVKEGWLRFDLAEYNIALKGNCLVAVEFLPETKKDLRPIYYEVKLGGASRSYYRKNGLDAWNRPPHHYCLYVTALVDKRTPAKTEDAETTPTLALRSAVVSDSFRVFVRLPKTYYREPHRQYPVIYHLDGNAYFDAISDATARLVKQRKLSPEPILVGIGYANAYEMDSLRLRDYTFPPALAADSLPASGGGDRFYRFIKEELVPYVDGVYRTDTTHRTLMGHSFGGYFTLYALLRDCTGDALFSHYVAASPSVAYGDNYLGKQLAALPHRREGNTEPNVYITAGEMELEEGPTDVFYQLIGLLESKDFIRVKTKIHQNLEHLGTALPTFEEGVRFSGQR
jgi:hypothetical protein